MNMTLWAFEDRWFVFQYALLIFLAYYMSVDEDLGPSLRDVCAANRSDEKEVVFWPLFIFLSSIFSLTLGSEFSSVEHAGLLIDSVQSKSLLIYLFISQTSIK